MEQKRTRHSDSDQPVNRSTYVNDPEAENFDFRSMDKNPSGTKTHPEKDSEGALAGFLVSYSKTDSGEFWPLREGNNHYIGCDNSDAILLKETFISPHHAVLTVRRSKNDNRLMYVISDNNSKTGVMVNNMDIEFKPFECNNLDKIQIGNYILMLMKADKDLNKLGVNPEFSELIQSKVKKESPDYSGKDTYRKGTKAD